MASWLDHYHKNIPTSFDATKVVPSFQQVDYQYASKVPFGTTNPIVPKYYTKQAQAQFKAQGQSSVIKKTDDSKQHAAQKLLNKVQLGNNDLANTVLDFTAKFPIQSGINLMNPQIHNDEDVARAGMDLLGMLPIINEAANLGVKGVNFAKPIYNYGNKAYKDAKIISDAEKLNNSLTPAYEKIKDIPEKIRRIGNIWSQPTVSYSEELNKLNKLKKLNVEEQHLKGITGLNKKQIDSRIEELNNMTSPNLHMPENPTLDDLTNLIAHQNENGFNHTIQNYIDHHINLYERRIRFGDDGQLATLGNDLNLNRGSINLERPVRRARLDQESRDLLANLSNENNFRVEYNPNIYTNLFNEPKVPSWIKNTIDKHFNKGLISKINPDDAVISTNPSLYRSSQNVDEALKETQKLINISPSGTKIRGANSLSDSSFPLVVSNIKRNYLNKNLKDVQFGGYNNLNFSGYLEKANIHPDVVVPYLNSHIDELSKTLGKKIPKAYYNDQGIFYPDLVGVKMQKGGQIFLQPNNPKLKKGYNIPDRHPSTELATSIGGENGEPAYLIPSFKQGHLLNNPVQEFNRTGEYLGGPFKTWQEADKWDREIRHPYVEKGQPLPSPLKWWGDNKTNTMIQKHKKGGRVLGLYEMMGMPIPFGFGGDIWSGIKNSGVMLADNATSIINQDIIKDSAYTGSSAKDFRNISHVTGGIQNSLAPLAAGALFGPAGSAAMSGIQQTSNMFVNPDESRIQSNSGQFMNKIQPLVGAAGQVGATAMSSSNSNSNNTKKAEGGLVDKAVINVEKGELEVDPNTLNIVKEFRNKPKHPAHGIDEQGNTMATVNNIIIPVRTKGLGGQPLSEEYKKASDLRKKAIINNLKFAQARREGIKYEYGGKIKKYDGTNGSVVGPRVDGGFYSFNDQGMSTNYGTNNLINNPVTTWTNNLFPKQPYSLSYDPASRQGVDSNGNAVSINPMASASYKVPGSEFKSPSQPINWNQAKGIGEKALEYSPAIYNMARGIFDKPLSLNVNDYLVNDRVDAPVLTGDAGRRDLLKGYNLAKYNNRQLGGTQAGMNNLFNNYADSVSKFNENLENTNKVAKFEASKYNIENKFRNSQTRLGIKQFNEQNKAEKRNQISKSLTQASDIFQNERNNKIIGNNLPNFLKYWNYNEADGTFSLRTNTGGNK